MRSSGPSSTRWPCASTEIVPRLSSRCRTSTAIVSSGVLNTPWSRSPAPRVHEPARWRSRHAPSTPARATSRAPQPLGGALRRAPPSCFVPRAPRHPTASPWPKGRGTAARTQPPPPREGTHEGCPYIWNIVLRASAPGMRWYPRPLGLGEVPSVMMRPASSARWAQYSAIRSLGTFPIARERDWATSRRGR